MFSKLKNLLTSLTSGEAKPSKEPLFAQMDALLAQGQLSQAFKLMKENGHPDVVLLQLQWHTVQQQLEQKRITIDDFNRTQNRLAYALREMTQAPGSNSSLVQPLAQEAHTEVPAPQPAQGRDAKSSKETLSARLDALLAQGQLSQAFELMKENGPPGAVPLQSKWHKAQQQLEQKHIKIEDFNLTQNALVYALREMAQVPGSNSSLVQLLPQEAHTEVPAPQPAQAPIDPGKRSAAIALLAQNRFKETLALLQHEGPDWQSLFERYTLLQRNERLGIISANDYKQTLEKLEQQVIQLIGPLETTIADNPASIGFTPPTQEEWARAAAEVEAGNWQEAIVIGQRWGTSWLLLFSRMQRTIRDQQNGLAAADDIVEELERIKWSFEILWAEEAKKRGE